MDHIPSPAVIMDMGSGNAVKTRHIIDAVLENQTTVKYHPVDISSGINVVYIMIQNVSFSFNGAANIARPSGN